MMVLPFILPLPLVAVAALFIISKRVCWKEALCLTLGVVVLCALSIALSFHGAVSDTETWNGSVTGKTRDQVTCRHTYECNCRTRTTGSGKNRRTTRHCDTCREHGYDVDWNVTTTVGNLRIATVDRQGTQEPPRWTAVRVGEPASSAHSYQNYIKAAPNSILRMSGQEKDFQGRLPTYPGVHDYYRVNHIVPVGVAIPNLDVAEEELGRVNGVLGPTKQVNILFVVVKEPDQRYVYALEQHWLGGKKNDLIVVLGVPDGQDKIEWAMVSTWSDVELLKVLLRDEVLRIGSVHRMHDIVSTTSALVAKHFVRKPMADFAYLKYQYSPSMTAMVIITLVALLFVAGLGYYFVKQDPFDSGFQPHVRYNRSRSFR